MKLQEIQKQKLMVELDNKKELVKAVEEIKILISKYYGKAWREPLKTNFKNEIAEKINFNVYINSFGEIKIYDEIEFIYLNLNRLCSNWDLKTFVKHNEDFFYAKQYEKISLEFVFSFADNKVNDNNNIEIMLNSLKSDIENLENVIATFDTDIEKLNDLTQKINSLYEEYNDINFTTRKLFNSDDYHFSHIRQYNGIYRDMNNNSYTLINLDYITILNNLVNNSTYVKNNLLNLYRVEIEEDNNLLNFYFYNDSFDNVIIYNYDTNEIVKNAYENLTYNDFDKFEKLTDEQQKNLKRQALLKIHNLKQKEIFTEDITYNDLCFISSSDLQGYYFPNIDKSKIDINKVLILASGFEFVCLAFLNGVCYAVFEKDNKIIVL